MATSSTFILLAGPEDVPALDKASDSGRRLHDWICAKGVQRGDRLLVYLWKPEHRIAATATADLDAWKDDSGRYRTTLRGVRWLAEPITLEEMREQLPKWRWTFNCSTRCRVPERFADWLWEIAERDVARPAKREDDGRGKSASPTRRGAGFGRAESNRIVEQAAVAQVTAAFSKNGYKVTSRERENIGYDLDVKRGSEVLHIEVKGVSGDRPEFLVTANEVACSKSDKAFRICVVTKATTSEPVIHTFTGKELNSLFELSPMTFRAKRASE